MTKEEQIDIIWCILICDFPPNPERKCELIKAVLS
jgi:hypothetical protein